MSGPRSLGKYEILDVLGVGGMGTVYRARDRVLERIVAVKLLHPNHGPRAGGAREGSDGWARFLNEARAVARLNHPAIVSVYDFSDTDPAGAFFAMEYVDGCAIETRPHPAADARVARGLDVMRQLLSGLSYAHSQGVVHRDIKPTNLLVRRDGRLKITDFGIAKVGSIKHTMTGMIIGTPAYMAPERYIGGDVDQRCDLYSAGVLLFELLTGRRPFSGALTEVMYQVCHVVPNSVSSVESAVPALLDPVLAKALAKDPAARFQTADEFAAALATVSEALGLAQHAAGSPSQPAPTLPVTPPPVPLEANTGWSPAQLADIEEQLAPILGPMARIVVKRAAARTRNHDRLREELAAQLRTDEERRRFLDGPSGAGSRQDVAAPAASLPSAKPDTTPNGTIPAATLERTSKILMRYIGPIAAVLIKKTATAALNEADFYNRLAERITDARERARFIAELTPVD